VRQTDEGKKLQGIGHEVSRNEVSIPSGHVVVKVTLLVTTHFFEGNVIDPSVKATYREMTSAEENGHEVKENDAHDVENGDAFLVENIGKSDQCARRHLVFYSNQYPNPNANDGPQGYSY